MNEIANTLTQPLGILFSQTSTLGADIATIILSLAVLLFIFKYK